jgi:hypothetical protein
MEVRTAEKQRVEKLLENAQLTVSDSGPAQG